MITEVRIKFDKLKADTGKAILVRIIDDEYWIPSKLCRKLVINNKLGGHVCIPMFFAEKIGLKGSASVEVIHHIPKTNTKQVTYDNDLFK